MRGEITTEMKIPVIRMCDGDMYPSYDGWYGVRGGRTRDRRSTRVGRRRRLIFCCF